MPVISMNAVSRISGSRKILMRVIMALDLVLAVSASAAAIKAVTYSASSHNQPLQASQATLAGSAGLLTEAPKFLPPKIAAQLELATGQKITREAAVFLAVSEWGINGYRAGRRYVALTDSLGNVLDSTAQPVVVRSGGLKNAKVSYRVAPGAPGGNFDISATFDNKRTGSLHTQIDLGGYAGATAGYASLKHFTESTKNPESGSAADDSWQAFFRAGQYAVTWKSAGDSLSLEVSEAVRGDTIPFGAGLEGHNWGFIPPGVSMSDMLQELGVAFGGDNNILTPAADRPHKLLERISAENTGNFYLYVDGQAFKFSNVTAMPAAGTAMTITSALGTWNGDGSAFTQFPDAILPGDRWRIEIEPDAVPDSAQAKQYTWGFSGAMVAGTDNVEVYLTVQNSSAFSLADLAVVYDPAVLQPVAPLDANLKLISRASQLELVSADDSAAGTLSLRLTTSATARPFPEVKAGSGAIISLKFRVIGTLTAETTAGLEIRLADGTSLAQYQMPAKVPSGVVGDVRADGKADIFDLLEILQVLGGGIPASSLSDVNGDGRTDIFDLLEWLKVAGK